MATKKSKTARVTAQDVLEALHGKNGPLAPPAHAVLHEVRNGTGYDRVARSADSLVVSCWPSRGIWFGGVEVKVDRVDWLRELQNPAKSAEIQKWCSYWWVAAPEKVIADGEVPETWGWYEMTPAGKLRLRKEAPRLEAAPPTATFVASILRNAANRSDASVQAAISHALEQDQKMREEAYKSAHEATNKLRALEWRALSAERERDELRAAIETFEREVGGGFYLNRYRATASDTGRMFKAACAISEARIEIVARQLELAAAALRKAL